MKRIFFLATLFSLTAITMQAQQPTDNRQQIRIVDTLTRQERQTRVPILLRAELDSMVNSHLASLPKEPVQEPMIVEEVPPFWFWISAGSALLLIILCCLFWIGQRRSSRQSQSLQGDLKLLRRQLLETSQTSGKEISGKKKSTVATEAELKELRTELADITKTNQGLEAMMAEYRHIKQDYEGLKQQMLDAYKVRFYPGFDQESAESEVLKKLIRTERSVAYYAYEKFLKPVLQITDANKNNPAKISDDDKQRLADCLVSLGLLYAEYLYLRISDLSVGGKIVERVGSFQKMNGIDTSLLKELNLEHGSRALALRMALDKMGIKQLSYPVFDETNLNLS